MLDRATASSTTKSNYSSSMSSSSSTGHIQRHRKQHQHHHPVPSYLLTTTNSFHRSGGRGGRGGGGGVSILQMLFLIVFCTGSALLLTEMVSYYASTLSSMSSLNYYQEASSTADSEWRSLRLSSSTSSSSAAHRDKSSGGAAQERRQELVPRAMVSSASSSSTSTNSNDPSSPYYFPKRSDASSYKHFHDDIKMDKPWSEKVEDGDVDVDPWPPQPDITSLDPSLTVTRNGVNHPHVAWLMSFPNSGTSFTIHMTRDASNCTTATNYALEGDVKNLPSTPAILGPQGRNGPFLELLRDVPTNVPPVILTKNHCTGYCSLCGPWKLLLETPRSFQRGCLSGTRAVITENGTLEAIDVMYSPNLVKKAIHIFRHPLDNIVARFHLEYNEMKAANNGQYCTRFPKNATGFKRWCERSDRNRKLLETKYLDEDLKRALLRIPCRNEFHKYVQWHNMAFYTTHDMQVETLLLHYHEYSDNFAKARDKVLQFLGVPHVATPLQFHPGKEYRHYYTNEEKKMILTFVREYSTPDTWAQLERYDFEIDDDELTTKSESSGVDAAAASAALHEKHVVAEFE